MPSKEDEEPALPLPSAPLVPLTANASLQPPLTRRGHGPGLIIVTPGTDDDDDVAGRAAGDGRPETLDPSPQKKWAEEGYAVVRVVFGKDNAAAAGWDVETALGSGAAADALVELGSCDVKDKFALIVYGSPAEFPADFAPRLKSAYDAASNIVASVSFSPEWDLSSKPALLHLAGAPPPPLANPNPSTTQTHHYPTAAPSPSFVLPRTPHFSHGAASVSHTRTLSFLKPVLGGPYFDLEAVWDEHTSHEFGDGRSVARTMATMVDEPYVNHVPTLAGGVGRAALTAFYRDRFIFSNPADTRLELVSRTVGVDRVVDEFVFCLTHDRVVDWLLPGVPPTHKPLRIPFTAVVNVRGDRLYHEHISWDQATALRQLGLLPEYLPFPYARRFEYRVPAAGAETAAKLEDGSAVESNAMFEFRVREVDG
ncbi:hypothetical protein F5X99DRAFT_416203 [Biscogniauxia marginata]|nr:hypothetical protein F5X99DRAFT_416203 [Biscogniauxia marginata]